jgi:myo-inositol-1-phosphate synthase
MSKIKVAIAGVGNCASALVQGLSYYSKCSRQEDCIGLNHLFLGGLHPRDIEVVAAFDIDMRKVGKPISQAIFEMPNNAPKIVDAITSNVIVQKGPVMDGVGEYTKHIVHISAAQDVDISKALKKEETEILLNLLPSGAAKASQWYAEQALDSGCAFINTTPNFIASNVNWSKRFEKAKLPVIGDDLVDQVGATTLHKTLLQLLTRNGVHILETYQLDVGGGTESLDTLGRTRDTKRIVKTESVEAALPYKTEVVAGSTDYVDFLKNKRDSYFWIKGTCFGKTPMQIDLKLSTVDAPNAGSVLFDVIRATKLAFVRGLKGAIAPICANFFKHPFKIMPLETAEKTFNDFIAQVAT